MIIVLLADGFEEIEALTPVDMLRRANAEVFTVGIHDTVVTGAHGIRVVCDMTYDELLAWDFGVHKSRLFRGTPIPRLSDFFLLCAKTGMRPMFSTHLRMSEDAWRAIRSMLERYRLLHLFHIESFQLEILEDAYAVFGDEIEGYTWDEGNARQFQNSALGRSPAAS